MTPEERTQALNKLPNDLRSALNEIEARIIYMEECEDSGDLTAEQRRAFFALIIDCIPYARIEYPELT